MSVCREIKVSSFAFAHLTGLPDEIPRRYISSHDRYMKDIIVIRRIAKPDVMPEEESVHYTFITPEDRKADYFVRIAKYVPGISQ